MAVNGIIDYSIKDVEKVVKFDGKITNVEISRLTAPGENYMSLVLRVDFEVQRNGDSKTISSVAKCLPLKKKDFFFDMNKNSMKTEIKWYAEILPLLKDFAKENEIKLDFYPEYYGSRYSLQLPKQEIDKDAVLLLENLIPQGYQNNDRYIGCDLITSKAILKNLAMFHALPIVIKIKKPELFQILKDFLDKSRPKPPDKNGPLRPDDQKRPPGPPPDWVSPEKLLLKELLDISDFAPYVSKIKPLFERPRGNPDEFNKLTKEPWNTITHNDLWVNNVMINYEKKKEPAIKIVDFQMCAYGSYAKDLVFFLLTSVRNDLIKEFMDDLLRVYYNEFTSILQKSNVNLELTYNDYLEEVRAVAQEKSLHALFFTTIIFGEKNTGVDTAVEDIDLFQHTKSMLKKMNQHQKDKMVVIASEAIKRKWI